MFNPESNRIEHFSADSARLFRRLPVAVKNEKESSNQYKARHSSLATILHESADYEGGYQRFFVAAVSGNGDFIARNLGTLKFKKFSMSDIAGTRTQGEYETLLEFVKTVVQGEELGAVFSNGRGGSVYYENPGRITMYQLLVNQNQACLERLRKKAPQKDN